MSQSLYTRLARKYAPERFSLSRRQMLKASMAASAGLLLSNCDASNEQLTVTKMFTHRRVIVIGAGFAGLACAHELHAAGYDVVVLEARNRLGGRVLTFKDMVPGRLIEGGGELIGDNHPTWAAYAERFKLTFREIPEEKDLEKPLILDGKRIDNAEAEKIFKELDATLSKLNEAAAKVDADQPWNTPDAATLDNFTMAQWLANVQASPTTRQAIRAELEGNEAVSLEKQSYLAFLTMVKGGGLQDYWDLSETKRCAEGNQALATALAETFKWRIHLSKPVATISHSPTGAIVTAVSGESWRADHVVLTAPPSTWGAIKFTPTLTSAAHVQMGIGVKHLSAVKKRFWKDAKLSAESASDGDVSMTWEGTEGYAGDAPAELTGFSGGPAAQRIRARPPVERMAFYQEYLTKLYPGYVDNLESVRFMDWPSDPQTQASYSFAAPGQITTAGPILYNGINRLHFAGEYACFKFCGYMEGGLNSGVSVARRIAMQDHVV